MKEKLGRRKEWEDLVLRLHVEQLREHLGLGVQQWPDVPHLACAIFEK
jgi:hypothetical protein